MSDALDKTMPVTSFQSPVTSQKKRSTPLRKDDFIKKETLRFLLYDGLLLKDRDQINL